MRDYGGSKYLTIIRHEEKSKGELKNIKKYGK